MPNDKAKLLAKIKHQGFVAYGDRSQGRDPEKDLDKINSQRVALSEADIDAVPTLGKGEALYATASSNNNEPFSCHNCVFFNLRASTCQLHSPRLTIKKFTMGEPFRQIEYWPCCGYHISGSPNEGEARYLAELDPDSSGLIWINAPKVGQPQGGANCGGSNGGDDCDFWETEGEEDKRQAKYGFCRVLRIPTANGDCCACWQDDDELSWQKAQDILNEKREETNGEQPKEASEKTRQENSQANRS